MTIRYLSLCSGIEAASVAWQPLGWKATAFAEIEPFPCAVLQHHYPDVPNLGDISQIDGRQFNGAVELVVAGTPCQDFSIAGKRAGMAGERSGLAREFIRLVREINPAWLVWENVPGVFSTNGGRDFGSFIKALDDSGYSCAWRVLDAQFFGVPQRRRRVFIVGYFGDWRPAAAILFERESVCRNFAQGKKAGKSVAGCLKGGTGKRGWENGAECNFIPQIKSHWEGAQHPCLNQSAKGSGGIGMSDQELFSQKGSGLVSAMSIRTAQTSSNGHGIAEDKAHTLDGAQGQAVIYTQNQQGYVPPIVQQAMSCKWAKGSSGPAGDEHHNLIAYAPEIAPAMGASGPPYERTGNARVEADALLVMATQQVGAETGTNLFQKNMQVRRLTPRECERLQGFPDDYTAIPYKGKPAPDSARYKALGNSMAVPVMRWIGKRIDAFCNNAGASHV